MKVILLACRVKLLAALPTITAFVDVVPKLLLAAVFVAPPVLGRPVHVPVLLNVMLLALMVRLLPAVPRVMAAVAAVPKLLLVDVFAEPPELGKPDTVPENVIFDPLIVILLVGDPVV